MNNNKDINELLYNTKNLSVEHRILVLKKIIESLTIPEWENYFTKKINVTRKFSDNKEKLDREVYAIFRYFQLLDQLWLQTFFAKEYNNAKQQVRNVNNNEYMSSKQVQIMLGVSRQTVYNYVQAGLLKAYKLRNNVNRFKKSDVLTLLETNKIKGSTYL
ncbi:MAG: DNA-binding protein [Rickettsiales bacterium]|nr:MAG: DNA-binding protein [Rickettsiales bacterium]